MYNGRGTRLNYHEAEFDTSMRVRIAISQSLRKTKNGSLFKSTKIHVEPEFIISLMNIELIGSCLIKERRHKLFVPVIDFDENFLGQEKFDCKITDIYICETCQLDHIFDDHWWISSTVDKGQEVDGRPSTQIMSGLLGSILFSYNWKTHDLVVSGTVSVEIPLSLAAFTANQQPEYKRFNMDLLQKPHFFVRDLQLCIVLHVVNMYVPTSAMRGLVTDRELKSEIWCIHWSNVQGVSSTPEYEIYLSVANYRKYKPLMFLCTREYIDTNRATPLQTVNMSADKRAYGLAEDVSAASKFLLKLVNGRDVRKHNSLDHHKLQRELDHPSYSITELKKIPVEWGFRLSDVVENVNQKQTYLYHLCRYVDRAINRGRHDGEPWNDEVVSTTSSHMS